MEKREFERRRKRLKGLLDDNAIAIVPTAPERLRNRDVQYPYRADSDFYYLTGFDEPDAVAVIIPGRRQGEYVLFCRERDPDAEAWDGARAGLEGARERYGADDAFPIDDLDDILPGLLENRELIYYTMGRYVDFDQRVVRWVNAVRTRGRAGVSAPDQFVALSHVIHEMRLTKSRSELKVMRQAARISVEAHRNAMAICQPGIREYELEAELMRTFMTHGSRSPAYPSIVGSGANACTLHYIRNDAVIGEKDLVLIDAGCEYDSYASDITRTFPASGEFTAAQREVYELVLEAQEAAIAKVVPGNHWNDPHEAAVRVLNKGLHELGILKGTPAKTLKSGAYRKYYMHRTGHWLGMDVHDVGDYRVGEQWRLLEPGMVMTVEPGLYFPPGSRGLAKKWQGIGIRIEDDVAVTRDGCDVLTGALPKHPDEIEAMVGAELVA